MYNNLWKPINHEYKDLEKRLFDKKNAHHRLTERFEWGEICSTSSILCSHARFFQGQVSGHLNIIITKSGLMLRLT